MTWRRWFDRRDREIDDEIESHLRLAAQDRIDRGEPPEEALVAARKELGNAGLVKEATRSVWIWIALEQLLQDFRSGSRILWKSPGLSATAVILTALVIGGNTSIYAMVHALVTKPAAGIAVDNLIAIGSNGDPYVGYAFHQEYAGRTETLDSLMAFGWERFALGVGSGSFAYSGAPVTPGYFETLGVRLAQGRVFTDEEHHPGAGLTAIISDRVWRTHFEAAEDILGQSILLNGHAAVVVGVTPAAFHGTQFNLPADVWTPLESYYFLKERERAVRGLPTEPYGVVMIGRLAEGASLEQAQAEFAAVSPALLATDPTQLDPFQDGIVERNRRLGLKPYSMVVFGGTDEAAPLFLALFSVVTALTLGIVCANVANLMLGRALVRRRDAALRLSLGASRGRILRLLFFEGLTLSAAAWAAACLLAFWISGAIGWLIPAGTITNQGTPLGAALANVDFTPDWTVLAYAMALAWVSTAVCTSAPAIRVWRQDVLPHLRSGEHGVAWGHTKLSRALVVMQLALSVVLLTSALLTSRSWALEADADLGFERESLLLVTVNPSLAVRDRIDHLDLLVGLQERLRAIPRVDAASYSRQSPPYGRSRPIEAPGLEDALRAVTYHIGPGYLEALGLAPLAGREFRDEDGAGSGRTAVISRNLAEAIWPGRSALGETLSVGPEQELVEIIGVAPDADFNGAVRGTRPYFLFLAEQQDRTPLEGLTGPATLSGTNTFYVRYQGDLDRIAPAVTTALREVDERVPVVYMRTMEAQIEDSTLGQRAVSRLLALFSGLALLIAGIGQYAVVSFDLKRRRRELGVRFALGASPRRIVFSTLRQGLALTAIGLAAGLALSLGVGIVLGSVWFGVTPTDPSTYLSVSALLAAVSLLACYLPARQAGRINPIGALRQD